MPVCVQVSGVGCGLVGAPPGIGAWCSGLADSPPGMGAWGGGFGVSLACGLWSGCGLIGLGVIGSCAASSCVLCPSTAVGGVSGEVDGSCGMVFSSSSSLSDDEYAGNCVVGG